MSTARLGYDTFSLDRSPKRALGSFCYNNRISPPRYVRVETKRGVFRVRVELEDFSIDAKSEESLENAENIAATEALRYLQHYQGDCWQWPFTINKIYKIFDSVSIRANEHELEYYHITGHCYPRRCSNEDKNIITNIRDIVETDDKDAIHEYLQKLAFQLQFTLEYNTLARMENMKKLYHCFVSVSKNDNMLCVFGSGRSPMRAKYAANDNLMNMLMAIFTRDKIAELKRGTAR